MQQHICIGYCRSLTGYNMMIYCVQFSEVVTFLGDKQERVGFCGCHQPTIANQLSDCALLLCRLEIIPGGKLNYLNLTSKMEKANHCAEF